MDYKVLYKTIYKVASYAMNQNDESHNMTHIHRVLKNARELLQKESELHPDKQYDHNLVFFGALMHDIGDGKYAQPGQDITIMARDMILENVPEPDKFYDFAVAVQAIVSGVSHSSEKKDPKKVLDLIEKYPELAIVQDADRLDSIGAAGIGRSFTYNATHNMTMQDSRDLYDLKLFSLEKKMKTTTGRIIAGERTRRVEAFAAYWDEETSLDSMPDFSTLSY